MKYGLGVDVGGTKIATVIINNEGYILERVELPSLTDDKEKMFKQVIHGIKNVLVKSNLDITMVEGMGIGVPGKVDRKSGIAVFQNNLPWKNFPIVERLKKHFLINNIAIDNDVYMAAFAEWKISNTEMEDTFVYVTISTGISCSIIQQGSFIRGSGFAGELGLLPANSQSPRGKIHTLEDAASGPAIQKIARKIFNRSDMSTEDFFKTYQNGNPLAQAAMNEVVENLAHSVYSIICLLDPQQIIFGGGVMNGHPYLLDLIKEKLNRYLIPEQKHVLDQMQTSNLKGNSGVVGAGLRGLEYLDYQQIKKVGKGS